MRKIGGGVLRDKYPLDRLDAIQNASYPTPSHGSKSSHALRRSSAFMSARVIETSP
jgi:hypothetical protein